MKKLILVASLLVGSALSTFAQSNDIFVGYSFLREDVKVVRPVVSFDENQDSHGVIGSYTAYFNKGNNYGLTVESSYNFKNSKSNLLTVMGGATAKLRSGKYVNPFVKALAGVARQEVSFLGNRSKESFAYSFGGGLDFKVNNRVEYRIGADLLNTAVAGERHNGVRLSTGFVF